MTFCPALARRVSWLRLLAIRPRLTYSLAVDGRHGRGGQAAGERRVPQKLRGGEAHVFSAGPEGGVFGGGDADADG